MAPAQRHAPASLIAELLARPEKFDFFQAVRLLLLHHTQAALAGHPQPHQAHAAELSSADEPVRFHAHSAAAFPVAAIAPLALTDNALGPQTGLPVDMTVDFLGLTGPGGVLPHHMTAIVIHQQREGNQSLSRFQDLFNNRLVWLFYAAWEKYQFAVAYERARNALRHPWRHDALTRNVAGLSGYRFPAFAGRHVFPDDVVVYYAGHFAHYPRNAAGLARMLSDYFTVPAQVEEFAGQWLPLASGDQTVLAGADTADGSGLKFLGDQFWDIQGRFRIRLGPLSLTDYMRFLPLTQELLALAQMIRAYAGPELDFEVQLVLKADEVPTCVLDDGAQPRLGWTTMLGSGAAGAVEGARFSFDDVAIKAAELPERFMQENQRPEG